MNMTTAELLLKVYPQVFSRLATVGSKPNFLAINPFKLPNTFMDGNEWRAVCPRCDGTGMINKGWAVTNRFSPSYGRNCFFCTRIGQKTGWHPLPKLELFEQVLVQTIIFCCHHYGWNPEKYLPVLKGYLTIEESDWTDRPYQEACFNIFSYYHDLLDHVNEEMDLEALLPDCFPVIKAARWYDASVALFDEENGLDLPCFSLEDYISEVK